MNTDKHDNALKDVVRVNVPNPDKTSSQERVVGYVPANGDGSTAIIAGGKEVRITDHFGVLNEDVIVNPK